MWKETGPEATRNLVFKEMSEKRGGEENASNGNGDSSAMLLYYCYSQHTQRVYISV